MVKSTLGYIDGGEVVAFDCDLFDNGSIPLKWVINLEDVGITYFSGGNTFEVVLITYIY